MKNQLKSRYFHENRDFYVPKLYFHIFSEKNQKIFPYRFFNPWLKTPNIALFYCEKCRYTIIISFENARFSEIPTVFL